MRKKKIENIEIVFEILRRKSFSEEPYLQKIKFTTKNTNETVASALDAINRDESFRDLDGNPIEEIGWECSCLQKKCGACAMVINKEPKLACDTFLKDYKKVIRLEPLKKFPVIRDLIVDRSVLFENLKQMSLWEREESGAFKDSKVKKDSLARKNSTIEFRQETSKCLQCGCCLEACPNFCPDETFFGAAAFVPAGRLISGLAAREAEELKQQYLKHSYSGCGKSLACKAVCPAGIDIENLLLKTNAALFWRK